MRDVCTECAGTGDNGPCGESPDNFHVCPVCSGSDYMDTEYARDAEGYLLLTYSNLRWVRYLLPLEGEEECLRCGKHILDSPFFAEWWEPDRHTEFMCDLCAREVWGLARLTSGGVPQLRPLTDRETERAALAEAMSQATVRVYEQEEEEGIEHDWRPKL